MTVSIDEPIPIIEPISVTVERMPGAKKSKAKSIIPTRVDLSQQQAMPNSKILFVNLMFDRPEGIIATAVKLFT